MKIIFDSNVYIRYLRDRTYAPVFERLCAELHSETYACGVVVAEIYAGVRDDLGRRAVGVLFRRLEAAGRIIAPAYQDWPKAGEVLSRLRGRRAPTLSLFNDILIALCARRIGALLITYNTDDFSVLREFIPFVFRSPTNSS